MALAAAHPQQGGAPQRLLVSRFHKLHSEHVCRYFLLAQGDFAWEIKPHPLGKSIAQQSGRVPLVSMQTASSR